MPFSFMHCSGGVLISSALDLGLGPIFTHWMPVYLWSLKGILAPMTPGWGFLLWPPHLCSGICCCLW